MKVILLTDIPKVGNKYDVKDFKEGYAQNVLLSKGLAELATPQALAKLEAHKAHTVKKKEEEMKIFEDLISMVGKTTVTIFAKANEKGHLFKAVNPHDVAEAIKKSSGVEVDEHAIVMDHIKELGMHTVRIKKGEREGKCQIVVEAQK
jgi:large subunit ribosomal protein L9